IALNGPISGSPFNSMSLTYSGTGTLTLGSGANTYAGFTTINSGTLALASGTAIPTNTEVDIENGAVFNIGGLSNTSATAISALVTNFTGTFRATSGSGDYYINDLVMNGGTVDLTGTTNFKLHIIRPNSTIRVGTSMPFGIANWIGSGTSAVLNDTGV